LRENIEKPVRKTNINKKPKAIFITRDSQYIEYKSGIDLLVPTLLSGISLAVTGREPAAPGSLPSLVGMG
jgi:hypothetical protein